MQNLSLKIKALPILALSLLFIVPIGIHTARADTIGDGDFNSQSYSKTVDWYTYVRAYAASHNLPVPPTTDHAYIYTNYINVGGFQLFYAGLLNATHNGMNVTIPLQTFFEHYKTVGGKDAITASSFLGLVSFRENNTDIYPNSPDRNDTIYASFSLGYPLSALNGHPYTYIATSTTTPLAHPDANHWTWGVKYTNLNAIWWRINPDPYALMPWDSNTPRGFAQYNELTFDYSLNIDPTSKTATLTTTYTIGRMTDLYILAPTPVIHLTPTGTYYLNGTQASTQTLYQYLQARQFKLSLVLSNKAILASPITDKDDSGASVDNNNDTDVSHTGVTTTASDGDKIFRSDFGVKSQYKLYNYTADTTENTASNYNVNVRTVNTKGWGGNPVFALQNAFMGFLPIFVANVDPGLIQQAKAGDVSFSQANYLYIISYPTWGGYKIVHDPDYTAFYTPSSNIGLLTAIFLAVAIAAGVGGLFAYIFRRRRTSAMPISGTGPIGPSPTQDPAPSGPAGPSFPGR